MMLLFIAKFRKVSSPLILSKMLWLHCVTMHFCILFVLILGSEEGRNFC